MIGFSAILADLVILAGICLCLLIAIDELKERWAMGKIATVVFAFLFAAVFFARFAGKSYYSFWLRSLEPLDVASITIGAVEVSEFGDKEKIVAAMNRSSSYFRLGNLDRPKPLVIKLRSGKQISWRVNYDRKHKGAAIFFSSGNYRLHYGWVYSATLVEAAAEAGISIPENPRPK